MIGVPYIKRRDKHLIGATGRASEKRLTRDLGGRARPASGAMEGAKGDISLGAVLLEAKSTINSSFALKLEWLLKIAREARSEGSMPALAVSFITPDGRPVLDGEWCLIPMHKFRELT
jgi:hypothetical protein